MTSPAPWWLAFLMAGGIALAAWYAGSLRPNGAVAATAIGALALRVHWSWGLFLITWFVLASLLSRAGRHGKLARTGSVISKGDRRDVWQVLANGGVFGLCAAFNLLVGSSGGLSESQSHSPQDWWLALAAAGALTAAGSDTWSTEIGTWIGGAPWSVRTLTRVAPGTSGAITLAGSLGGMLGAGLLALLAWQLDVVPRAGLVPVLLGGVLGATADTLLGAWWQERRWCDPCGAATERDVHSCGASTRQQGGVRGLGNDAVNGVCTLVGAVSAVTLGAIGIGPG